MRTQKSSIIWREIQRARTVKIIVCHELPSCLSFEISAMISPVAIPCENIGWLSSPPFCTGFRFCFRGPEKRLDFHDIISGDNDVFWAYNSALTIGRSPKIGFRHQGSLWTFRKLYILRLYYSTRVRLMGGGPREKLSRHYQVKTRALWKNTRKDNSPEKVVTLLLTDGALNQQTSPSHSRETFLPLPPVI